MKKGLSASGIQLPVVVLAAGRISRCSRPGR